MTSEFSPLLDKLLDGNALTEADAYGFMHELAKGEMEPALAGALPCAWRTQELTWW